MWRTASRAALDLTSSVALGLGVILLAFPLAAVAYVNGDEDVSTWFRSAPEPFDVLAASGSIELVWFVFSSWVLAACLLGVGAALRLRLARDRWTRAAVVLLALCAPLALLLGTFAVLALFGLP